MPQATEGDFVIKDFRFASGETLPELKIHYRTLGDAAKNAQGVVTNAVLIMHGTGGTGAQFAGRGFAGELFLPGQPLDVTKYFIVMPDDIGHGKSSKPSDGLRAKFPRYGYQDMLTAEHALLTQGLGVNHLRLVMGTSMGGMHTWLWGERWPEFMDALMPLASVPGQISGRNRVWRRIVIDAIRNDPEWQGGNYTKQPQSARTAAQMLWLVSSNPVIRQRRAPTLAQADKEIDDYVANWLRTGDANDQLYALESSFDYDPGPGPREDHGAAPRDQLRRRPGQPAGDRPARERDHPRAEGARDHDPAQRQDRRPRHAHAGRGVESSTWWSLLKLTERPTLRSADRRDLGWPSPVAARPSGRATYFSCRLESIGAVVQALAVEAVAGAADGLQLRDRGLDRVPVPLCRRPLRSRRSRPARPRST